MRFALGLIAFAKLAINPAPTPITWGLVPILANRHHTI